MSRERIITSNIWSSELSKLAANAFLAQRISSINAISALCEKTEADVSEVAKIVGIDSAHRPQVPECQRRLRRVLLQEGHPEPRLPLPQYTACEEVADYWERVVRMNEYQKERFVLNMLTAMFNTLAGKRIASSASPSRPTRATRARARRSTSPGRLLEEHAEVVVTDPQALDERPGAISRGWSGDVSYEEDPYKAARGCHAIAVMTEWDLYRDARLREDLRTMVQAGLRLRRPQHPRPPAALRDRLQRLPDREEADESLLGVSGEKRG